ncbi:MAG: 2-C-methyl-D-erythritol 4-phosphate cytidylyltransferase [Thermoanaerobaculia bacterium]
MSRFLIVPAAGSGTRLGRSEPKALVPLLGRPLLLWTLQSLSSIPFARTVVAVPPERVSDFEALLQGRCEVVAGGQTRAASVRQAFERLGASSEDLVCIHDAARPLVTAHEAAEVLAAAERVGAAVAVIPVVDTVKRVKGARIVGTVDREGLFAAGTPQAFRAALLARALGAGKEATDEAALCESLGIPVAAVAVARLGFKITTPEDLEIAKAVLKTRKTEDGRR